MELFLWGVIMFVAIFLEASNAIRLNCSFIICPISFLLILSKGISCVFLSVPANAIPTGDHCCSQRSKCNAKSRKSRLPTNESKTNGQMVIFFVHYVLYLLTKNVNSLLRIFRFPYLNPKIAALTKRSVGRASCIGLL